MVLIWKYRIEGSMFTAICIPSFGMDRNCTVYWCKYWVALNPGLDGVGSNMHFHYCPWTGSIKPSLQYFHICRVRWLSKFPFHLFQYHSSVVCAGGGCRSIPLHSISAVISYVLWRSLSTILVYVNSTSRNYFCVLIFWPGGKPKCSLFRCLWYSIWNWYSSHMLSFTLSFLLREKAVFLYQCDDS